MPYTIDVTTDIAATPGRVWRALTNPGEVARWDTTVIADLDAPPDYPQPGQHVRWRCRDTTELLHDRPQHVEPGRRLHAHLDFGRQRLDETYTLEPSTGPLILTLSKDEQRAVSPEFPNTARPEALEGREMLQSVAETPPTSSLSLEGEGRAEGAPDQSHQPLASPSPKNHPDHPANPWPNPVAPETPETPETSAHPEALEGHTTLHLHIDLRVRAPFIAGPLLLHLIDGPATRRNAEAALTNLKYYCELSPG